MLKEDETRPFKWVLARIVSVHPGNDGVIRAVTVRTGRGIYKRPIVKVCPLPVEEGSSERCLVLLSLVLLSVFRHNVYQ